MVSLPLDKKNTICLNAETLFVNKNKILFTPILSILHSVDVMQNYIQLSSRLVRIKITLKYQSIIFTIPKLGVNHMGAQRLT